MGNDIIAEDAEGEAKAENKEDEEKGIFPVTIPTIIFQFIMVFASMYFGMLFTNWGNMTLDTETKEDVFEGSSAPMWIKIISQWLAIALFTVSISLKICCPDRIV